MILLFETLCQLVLLLYQTDDSAIKEIHHMVAKLAGHCIRLSLEIIDLGYTKLDVI